MPKSKIVPLNEKGHTPEVILRRTLDKIGDIAEVVIVIHWTQEAGGGWGTDWSSMGTSSFATMGAVLDHRVRMHLDEQFDPEK